MTRSTTFKTYDNSLNPNSLNLDLDKIWLVMQELNVKNFISDNKLQEILDSLIAGNVKGLPAEILARIAGDENTKSLVNIETLRAYQAESNLSVRIDNESLIADQNILAEKHRAEAMEQSLLIQVNSVGVGNKAYRTYALMDADKASIPAKSKVTVTNDATASNNGDWQWDGSIFTKSIYDPVTQAKEFTKDRIDLVPMTGYDFAIQDQFGNIALGIKKDGGVEAITLESGKSTTMSASTGVYEHVWSDKEGNIALGIRKDGAVIIPKLIDSNDSTASVTTKTLSIVESDTIMHIGDSMTANYYCVQDKSYVSQLS